MTDKTQYFILELFNVPNFTAKSNLSIQNNRCQLRHWNVKTIQEQNGSFVAYIRLMMENASTAQALADNISVSANNHDVMGTDVFIHTKASYEEKLTKLVENYQHNDSEQENQLEIRWLTDLLSFEMATLDSLIFLDHDCPLYTDTMVSTYWKYIEQFTKDDDDEDDDDLYHDVNSDIGVMENTTMPTEKHLLAYHGKDSEVISEYLDAKNNIEAYYPVKTA